VCVTTGAEQPRFEMYRRELPRSMVPVMSCTENRLVWWDRDVDQAGRRIRPDVRLAGHEIWACACQRTRAAVGEHAPAAELMERAVAQVSRYLERVGAPLSPRKHGLLLAAFSRTLRRYAAKSARLHVVGDSNELFCYIADERWMSGIYSRLQLENIVRKLSARNGNIFVLRAAGYKWKEIARLFGSSVAAVRSGFWREIDQLRSDS
jgi:DNA-directed RNA polymerase specialized sigma24 family protein